MGPSPPQASHDEMLSENLRQTALAASSSVGPAAPPPPLANGLDSHGNPDLTLFKTEIERKLANLTPIRDVDWRGGRVKDCNGPSQRRAAQVQRIGTAAPSGGSCYACGSGFGPFSSCVVLVHGGQPHFGGACANCSFNGNGKSCSFRKSPPPPKSGPPQAIADDSVQ